MIDQNPPADPTGPPGVGYVIFRTYIPSGGNTTVKLPTITVTNHGHSTTLAPCTPSATKKLPALTQVLLFLLKEKMSSGGTPASCTSDCAPDLQYFGPSAASAAGLFPNPVNGYIVMSFTPRRGYVVVTHGEAPSSPIDAGSGAPGDSIGAAPVSWVSPVFQVRYWSISNYLAESPYPVVEVGHGARAIFGGTPDFLTTLDDGYYTVVSSLPADKPTPSSLTANDATWIPTSASHPGTPELQILRNMLSQQALYPEGFTFLSPPASPSDIIGRPRCKRRWAPTTRRRPSAPCRPSRPRAGPAAWPRVPGDSARGRAGRGDAPAPGGTGASALGHCSRPLL